MLEMLSWFFSHFLCGAALEKHCSTRYQCPDSLLLMGNVILQSNFFLKLEVYDFLQGSIVLSHTASMCFLRYHLPFKQVAVEFWSSDLAVSGFIWLFCSGNLIRHNEVRTERKAF